YGGRHQTLIAVSNPLTWATTPSRLEEEPASLTLLSGEETQDPAAADPASALTEGSTAVPTPNVPHKAPLTDLDVSQRSPCLIGATAYDVETTVLRSARKGRLATHVVCPGLLYGRGECEATFFNLFKQCWEATSETPALSVYGSGANCLPMLHISDLAQYVTKVAEAAASAFAAAAVAKQDDTVEMVPLPQYLLVADESRSTQGAVVQAVSTSLGIGKISNVPQDQLLLRPGLERFILDLSFTTSTLPGYDPKYKKGLLAHLDAVVAEFKQTRRVSPLRVIITGPPMAGKSALASRLAHTYSLRHITAKDILATVGKAPLELQKAVQAEMTGKDPRVSIKNMTQLLKILLTSDEIRNRGYILDAFPKSVPAAKFAFLKAVPLSAEDLALKEKEEEKQAPSPVKGTKAPKGKDAKGGKGAIPDGPEVPDGQKLVVDPSFAPTHVIELSAEEEELRLRLKAVEAAEIEAARAAAAAASAAAAAATHGKGGAAKEKPVTVNSHNNEKDFQRRLDAFSKIKTEEADDLQAKVNASQQRWAQHQLELEEMRKREEAEANTLKAKRRRARMESTAAAAAAHSRSASPLKLTGGRRGSPDLTTAVIMGTAGAATSAGEGSPGPTGGEVAPEVQGVPEGPKLPEYGGLPGLLVHEYGAKMLKLLNPNPEEGVLLPEPSADASGKPRAVVLPVAEEAVKSFLGSPHNFDGFIPDEPPLAPPLMQESTEQRHTREQVLRLAHLQQEMETLRREAQAEAQQAKAQRVGFKTEPLHMWLMSQIMPTVADGLATIARDRPPHPLRVLAARLLQEAEKVEALYIDPYTDPAYEIQIAKHREKEARDAERAAAASAKEQREMAAKLAAKAEAERRAEV
ncbi:hypothetical protein CEUSTIGMA_g13448.t1, partial [Chlamydomonas eustigma]